jgi:hypothetical protein
MSCLGVLLLPLFLKTNKGLITCELEFESGGTRHLYTRVDRSCSLLLLQTVLWSCRCRLLLPLFLQANKGLITCELEFESGETRHLYTRVGRSCSLLLLQTVLWSCRESNPGPNKQLICFLHVYFVIDFRL